MKVKEFIETLKEFNPNADVILVNDYSGGLLHYDEEPGWECPDIPDDPDPDVRKENYNKTRMSTKSVYFHIGKENNEK